VFDTQSREGKVGGWGRARENELRLISWVGTYGTPLYTLYRYVQPFLLKLGIEFNRVDVKYG